MGEQNLPQNEEIELGSLFIIIGKGFHNLFNAIGQFFKSIFHYFILFLVFLRSNALKIGIAAFIGTAIGLYFDLSSQKQFISTMIVKPNFKSTQQLYKNINYYDELVKQKDSILLAEALNISVTEASKLKSFSIEPIINKNEKYELFDEFVQEIDSTLVRHINFKEFTEAFTDYDYHYHLIQVTSLSNTIFEKLSNPIVKSIENNPYFKNQKKINSENLVQNERILIKSLEQVDTLRKIYNEVLLTEAHKQRSGTSINLAKETKNTSEIELFDESLILNEELIDNNTKKAKTTEILNVVSTFNKIGEKERGILKKKTFIFSVSSGILMLIFILLLRLNKYLVNYNKD